jgi:adenylate cyclase
MGYAPPPISESDELAGILSTEAKLRLQRAETLLGITQILASAESLDEVLEALVDVSAKVTGAERGSLFLYDSQTRELYSRVAQCACMREIRFLSTDGIAGHTFTSGIGTIIDDPYSDPRFNRGVDGQTGFLTKTILCAPIRTTTGEIIGVIECLNKLKGPFTADDLDLLEALGTQAATALRDSQLVDRLRRLRKQELEFLDIVADITSEINLTPLLRKVIREVTGLLNAERSTLFLHDDKSGELWSKVGEGLGAGELRMKDDAGIAGHVFTTGEVVNIAHAYADLRFNPAFDRQTGYFTRSILCVPIVNKHGRTIGVTQVLNKTSGPFTPEDESRLKAFCAQVSIALENATLFEDIQNMRNYNECMLQSMSNGVITLDEDLRIVTCNSAGLRIIQRRVTDVVKQPAASVFSEPNAWVLDRIDRVAESRATDIAMGAELVFKGRIFSVNATVLPLVNAEKVKIGTMIVIEDISSEKRVKSTMSRYMDPSLADELLTHGDEILGGKSTLATILFTDIRDFTALAEELGPQGTVALLNEYFTVMVECLQRHGGILDKFIGDAMMAAFGIPFARDDDEDRAVRTAVSMIRALAAWNRQRSENGLAAVDMGIGINTDIVVSGNIGSTKRMDYTMIGDGVNLAARLEGACKHYHTRILISENTLTRLKGGYRIRDVDRVLVRGKTEPVGLYEVLDYHTEATFPDIARALRLYHDGLEFYRSKRFEIALRSFAKVLEINPRDGLSRLYVDRCQAFLEAPPDGNWNGIWVLKGK